MGVCAGDVDGGVEMTWVYNTYLEVIKWYKVGDIMVALGVRWNRR